MNFLVHIIVSVLVHSLIQCNASEVSKQHPVSELYGTELVVSFVTPTHPVRIRRSISADRLGF